MASGGLPASFRIASESSALGALDEVRHVPTGTAVESSLLRVAVYVKLPCRLIVEWSHTALPLSRLPAVSTNQGVTILDRQANQPGRRLRP